MSVPMHGAYPAWASIDVGVVYPLGRVDSLAGVVAVHKVTTVSIRSTQPGLFRVLRVRPNVGLIA